MPSAVGHQSHRVLEHRGAVLHHLRQRGVVDRSAEAHLELGLGGVVARGVGRLEHRHRVDPVADPAGDDRPSMLAKPGLMPLPKIDTPPCSQAAIEPVAALAEGVAGDERGGADRR